MTIPTSTDWRQPKELLAAATRRTNKRAAPSVRRRQRRLTQKQLEVMSHPPESWLAIDPSAIPHHIGWALYRHHQLIECGNLTRLKGSPPLMDRLAFIVQEAQALIAKHNPSILLIEQQYLGRNTKTLQVLTAAKTVWITLALQRQITVEEITPTVWQASLVRGWKMGLKREAIFRAVSTALSLRHPTLNPSEMDPNIVCALGIATYYAEAHPRVSARTAASLAQACATPPSSPVSDSETTTPHP